MKYILIFAIIAFFIAYRYKNRSNKNRPYKNNNNASFNQQTYNNTSHNANTYNPQNSVYEYTAYYQQTRISYGALQHDKGSYGEYQLYLQLKDFENFGARFLFNLYLPKGNGETTELDVLMICPKGIFVFENKNYSGWIFGKEKQQNWYQTLPIGKGRSEKNAFFNPIMQNYSHIRCLAALIGKYVSMYSVIVFSDSCTLKSLEVYSNKVSVVNLRDVTTTVYNIYSQIPNTQLSPYDISNIYNILYPYTCVSADTKRQHINNIKNHLASDTDTSMYTQVNSPSPSNTVKAAETTDSTSASIPPIQKSDTITTSKNNTNATKTDYLSCNPLSDKCKANLKCPRCGGKLIVRNSVRGAYDKDKFYGCSNYPKCRYTQNPHTYTNS